MKTPKLTTAPSSPPGSKSSSRTASPIVTTMDVDAEEPAAPKFAASGRKSRRNSIPLHPYYPHYIMTPKPRKSKFVKMQENCSPPDPSSSLSSSAAGGDDKDSPDGGYGTGFINTTNPDSPVPAALLDPMCDPENPKIVTFSDVSASAYKIKDGIERTPCKKSPALSRLTGMEIYLKKEFYLVTGSFKERGARNTLLRLTPDQAKIGVIAASAGNHALALAYHGQQLGIPVTVVMPEVAPLMKINCCRGYAAEVIIHGKHIGEAREKALGIAEVSKKVYINGFDHPHVIAGQGTVGLEIIDDVPKVDAIVVPIGGGGLVAGIALVAKQLAPHVQIIGVEPEQVPSFTEALKANKPTFVSPGSTISDGLAVPIVGVNAFASCRHLVDKVVLVSESSIAIAILRLVELEKAVVEGAGAIGLAAILAGMLPELKGKKVVVPLCGGNIDTTVLGRCIDRGLAEDGRLVCFLVTVSDRPGGIAELTGLLAKERASIKDMYHERAWLKSDIFSVRVRVIVETNDKAHARQVDKALRQHYKFVVTESGNLDPDPE